MIDSAGQDCLLVILPAHMSYIAMPETNVSPDNKLAIAIWAASIAVLGNAFVAYINGNNMISLEKTKMQNQLILDSSKAEADRILAMIKTDDPDRAAQNLKFLLETALIDDPDTAVGLIRYLERRRPGQGISLPATAAPARNTAPFGQPVRRSIREEPEAAGTLASPQAAYLLKRYGRGLRKDELRPFVTLKYITQDQRNMK